MRFLKQILTPAGADALSDSDTRLSFTTSFRRPLSKLDKWVTVGEKTNLRIFKKQEENIFHVVEKQAGGGGAIIDMNVRKSDNKFT